MSKVFCPECNKEVSSYAESCPDCGFPIAKYLKDNNLADFSKTFVCPKCGWSWTATDLIAKIKCDYCGTPMFQTVDSTEETIANASYPKTEEEIDQYIYSLLERSGKIDEYSKEAHDHYREKLDEKCKEIEERERREAIQSKIESNQPHCPVCQSANIEKIGMFKRILSTSMFGIASDKVGKQWHCKSCGNNF